MIYGIVAKTLNEAQTAAKQLKYPIRISPCFSLSAAFPQIVHTPQDLDNVVERGLNVSPVKEILLEELEFSQPEPIDILQIEFDWK
jgi:carbamoyl-phosphate synthase large subunit